MSWWVFVSHSSKVKIKWFNLKSFNKKIWLKRNIFYIVTHIYIYIYTYLPIFLFAHLFFWAQLFSHPEKNSVVEMRCFCFPPGTGEQYSRRDATVGSTFGGRDFCHQRCRWYRRLWPVNLFPPTVGLFTIGFPKKKAGYEPLISGGRRLGGVGWPSMIKSFVILTVIYN